MLQHCRPYSNPVSSNTRFPRIPSNAKYARPCRTTSRCDSRLSKQNNIRRIRHVLRDTVFFPSPDSTPSAPTDGNAQAEVPSSTPWNAVRLGFGLLGRGNGFSIASLTASLPGSKDKAKSILGDGEEAGQRLVSVNSRPGSVKSGTMNEDEGMSDEDGASEDDTGNDEEEEGDEMAAGV